MSRTAEIINGLIEILRLAFPDSYGTTSWQTERTKAMDALIEELHKEARNG